MRLHGYQQSAKGTRNGKMTTNHCMQNFLTVKKSLGIFILTTIWFNGFFHWLIDRSIEFLRNYYLHQRRRLLNGERREGSGIPLVQELKRNCLRKKLKYGEVKQQKMTFISMLTVTHSRIIHSKWHYLLF